MCLGAESNNFPGKLEGIVDGEITKLELRILELFRILEYLAKMPSKYKALLLIKKKMELSMAINCRRQLIDH